MIAALFIIMTELTKQQYNTVIAQVAEFGTGTIQTAGKEPPWLVRNVDGFIYAVERMREYVICTVLVPAVILKNRKLSEVEDALEELNGRSDGKYGYYLKYIAEIPLITLSVYYFYEQFDVQNDILALERHALHILNEI